MIVIKCIRVSAQANDISDFLISLSSNASDRTNYTTVVGKCPIPMEAKIVITLPDNCLVLHNSWDKYILHNLENNKLIDAAFIKKRLGLVDRGHSGIFPEIKVEYPSYFRKLISHLGISL